ncbi:hypothetical protein ACJMK2_036356 [Sinanodonta woodiana]|uniref:Uncharacterized protein n=1 Tax=Sinanodonta woodiana TaxID=1069815 RepID=A0ABD3WGZ6_SINWO
MGLHFQLLRATPVIVCQKYASISLTSATTGFISFRSNFIFNSSISIFNRLFISMSLDVFDCPTFLSFFDCPGLPLYELETQFSREELALASQKVTISSDPKFRVGFKISNSEDFVIFSRHYD